MQIKSRVAGHSWNGCDVRQTAISTSKQYAVIWTGNVTDFDLGMDGAAGIESAAFKYVTSTSHGASVALTLLEGPVSTDLN